MLTLFRLLHMCFYIVVAKRWQYIKISCIYFKNIMQQVFWLFEKKNNCICYKNISAEVNKWRNYISFLFFFLNSVISQLIFSDYIYILHVFLCSITVQRIKLFDNKVKVCNILAQLVLQGGMIVKPGKINPIYVHNFQFNL